MANHNLQKSNRYMNAFDQDSAITKVAENQYTVELPAHWNIFAPNGGFLAACVMRTMTATVADSDRIPRSLNVHYLSAPKNEPMDIEVQVERQGGRMTTTSARFTQGDRLIGLATAAFAMSREGVVTFNDMPMPDVPKPDTVEAYYPFGKSSGTQFHKHFELRRVFGEEFFSGGDQAVTGGWVRLKDLRPPDAFSVAMFTDCWPPAFFIRSTRPVPAPTIDLTVHFRADINRLNLPEDAWVLVRFETRLAHDGYIEEDGIIWSENGQVLAHSRQLGLCEPSKR